MFCLIKNKGPLVVLQGNKLCDSVKWQKICPLLISGAVRMSAGRPKEVANPWEIESPQRL